MNKFNQTASPDDIDITALWRAVMDKKKLLLLSALGVGAITFLAMSLVTPVYTATTRIIIENDETFYNQPSGQNQPRDTAPRLDKEAVISQVHVLRSRDLAADVIKKLRLPLVPEFNSALDDGGFLSILTGGSQGTEEERVLRAFEDKLSVYPIKESRIISVDMSSVDPELAAAAANALAEGYIAWQRGRQVNQTRGESESLGRQLEDLREAVAKADFKLEKFRSETGLYAGQNNVTLSAQQLSEVNSQLSLAKAQRSESEARARQIREMLNSGSVDAAPDVLRSQLIQRLLEQRVQVQRQISELSATLLPRHPRMKQLISERAGISRQIKREVRKIVTGLENEARIAGAREKSLLESLDQVRQQAAKTGNDQVRLTLLEREAKSKRTLYEATLAKFDEASSLTNSSTVPVYARIVETARPTSIPSYPQKMPMTVFAMAATLLLGLAYVVTRALLTAARPVVPSAPGSGSTPGDSGGRTDDLGQTGHAAGAATTGPTAMGAPAMSETTRTTCDSAPDLVALLLKRGQGKPGFRTMVTTSAKGRSALGIATEVARGLSREGERCVVISGERTGTFDKKLPDAAGGFTDVINGRIGFQEAIRHDKASDVDVVDAGVSAFDWSDTRHADVVNRILDRLDDTYDQVLLAAEPESAARIFSLVEGRFDHGVVSGSRANGNAGGGEFLGFDIPEFNVATLKTPARRPQSSVRAQFASPGSPAPAAT
ncbi:MAG: GumC family protein [Hyphomicrobiaceae bacterium]